MIKDKKDKVLVIRISESDYKALKKICDNNNLTVSRCVREYIRSLILKFAMWLLLDE